MDILYRISLNSKNIENVQNSPAKCKISTTNILAFVSERKLTLNKKKSPIIQNNWNKIYVCDILSPWLPYKVCATRHHVTVLEWDISGKYLLVGEEGFVRIWTQKDSLLSDWIQLAVINFPGESIVKAVFFHNGRKIAFASEKRELNLPYLDKFQKIKFSPSVRQFGGIAAEGCLVITSTGLLGTFLIPQDVSTSVPIQLKPVTQSLGLVRNYLTAAAISYYGKTTEGYFRIAVANGEKKPTSPLMVQSFRVSIKFIENKLILTSHALPSFFLHEGIGRDLPDLKINALEWNSQEDSDSLIVAMKSGTNSLIELWSLVEKVTPIHKILQTNKTDSSFKTIAWNNLYNFRYNSVVLDVCVSKLNFENAYAIFVMQDNSLQVLSKDLKKKIGSIFLTTGHGYENDQPLTKQSRNGSMITSIDCTYFGHLLLGIDNQSQIFAIRLPQPYQDLNNFQMISHVTSLCEHSILTGFDAADIFVSMRPQFLDNIIDKLTENFTHQPSSVQQYYYVNFLTMKISLYRLQVNGQSKANDLTSLLMLHSILITFKSLLRPSSDLDFQKLDKGPAENLAMVLAESNVDVDKVLVNLDAKEFTVEPLTLQSLQQLIQWVADLALNLLAKLPQNCISQNNKNIGYDISKDIVALNSIRELLVMIRIWGLLNTHCLPVFSRTVENLDILATLFRLLTRLSLNPEPDENLLDECVILPSQVLIPQLQFVSSITSVASPLLHLNSLPLQLNYNIEPEFIKFHRDNPLIEGGLVNDGVVDSVRNLMLGKKPATVRKCIRCLSCSSSVAVAKTAALKAWEQRWVNNCSCGGYWIQKS